MDQEIICDWPSDDGSQPRSPDLSSSEDEESQIATLARSQLRPAGSALAFVPYANWNSERSYDGEPTIRWNMKWKIKLNTRKQAGQSELNIVISPRKFWKHVLQPRVDEAASNKPWKREKTIVVLGVTDRRTKDVEKEYKDSLTWAFETEIIREWSRFLNQGKEITIDVTFCYEPTGADTGRSGRGGATANQLADLDARTTGRFRGKFTKHAYEFAECRKPKSCTNGSDHCVDLDGKHLPILPHHVRMLRDHLQAGNPLNGYDDVPHDFRRLVQEDARQREEREQKERDRVQSRKRKRRDSDGSLRGVTMIHCPCAPTHGNTPSTPRMVFPTSPVIELNLPRDEGVREYNKWQRSQVSADDQRQHYDKAQELTLTHGYDLDVLVANRERMHRFFTEHGVMDGVAWHYVCDVKKFVKHHEGN